MMNGTARIIARPRQCQPRVSGPQAASPERPWRAEPAVGAYVPPCYAPAAPMILRLPESGSLVASLLSGLDQVSGSAGGDTVDDVSPEQLDEALAAMRRGEIEYVIVEDGDDFIQAAGDGEGPYQVR